MTAYYILLGVPAIIALFVGYRNSEITDIKTKINNGRIITVAFFAIYLLMLILRDKSIGTDIDGYLEYFNIIKKSSWRGLSRATDLEIGYVILNKIISVFTDNEQIFLGVIAVITVLPISFFYYKESENAILSAVIFANMAVFPMMFSGLRQAIAMGLAIPAFYCVKHKKIIPFILIVLLATSFHNSAFLLAFLYPIYHIKITQKSLVFVLPLLAVIFLLRAQIFSVLVKFLNEKYQETYGEAQETGAFAVFLLFIMFCAYAFLIADDDKMDADTLGLRNILVLVTFIQVFASVNTIAMRMNYYFIPFVPVLLSRIYNRRNRDDFEISEIGNIVLLGFFFMYFFYFAKTDADILEIHPYIPFWK